PPQQRISSVDLLGTAASMSRSMIPLPRCSAPAAWASFHSLSSRTSISFACGFAARRSRVSATFISLIRLFASLTILRKPAECFILVLSSVGSWSRYRERWPPAERLADLDRRVDRYPVATAHWLN